MPVENQLVQISLRDKFAEDDFHALFPQLNSFKLQNLLTPQVPIENLSVEVSDNIITPSAAPVPDCMVCGACCAFLLCVAVKPTDKTSDVHFWKIINKNKDGEIVVDQFMRRDSETAACVALDGKIGEGVGCNIYEERPQVCREFEAGSDKCHALRRAYGIEPPLTTERTLESLFRLELKASHTNSVDRLLYAKIVAHPETEESIIVAVMEDDSKQVIHIFNPNEENWLQSEFAGLTLHEALKLIRSRSKKYNED